jgi:hypothetical protein
VNRPIARDFIWFRFANRKWTFYSYTKFNQVDPISLLQLRIFLLSRVRQCERHFPTDKTQSPSTDTFTESGSTSALQSGPAKCALLEISTNVLIDRTPNRPQMEHYAAALRKRSTDIQFRLLSRRGSVSRRRRVPPRVNFESKFNGDGSIASRSLVWQLFLASKPDRSF